MKEPKIPEYTCPMIDRLKKIIEDAYQISRNVEDNYDQLLLAVNEINSLLYRETEKLEEIRKANSQLRECVEYWKDKVTTTEEDLKNSQEVVSDLKDVISDLEHQCKQLEAA